MNQLHLLYQLQQIDDEIGEKKERLRQVLRGQKENQALLAAQERVTAAGEALGKARAQQKDLELDLGTLNTNRKRAEERLYSGRVKNPKELGDLEQQIASMGRRRADLEDDLLEAMLLVEEAEGEAEAAEVQLEEAEAEWEERTGGLSAEQDELAVRLNALLEERAEQVAKVPGGALAEYEETRRRRGGIAVAALHNGLCQVCGVRASARKIVAARSGEIIHCGSCDRILYLP